MVIALGVFCLLTIVGCQKQATEETEEQPNPKEEVNPNKPNANHLIIDQRILGDTGKGSQIYDLIDAGDGGFLFSGVLDDRYVVGRSDLLGNIGWTRRLEYRGRDLVRIPVGAGQLTGAVLTVGGYDSNGDGRLDEGKVLLCSGSDGALMGDLTLHSTGHDVWFNTVELYSKTPDSSQFVAFGAAESLGVRCPLAVRFTVMNTGTISKGEEFLFRAMPSVVFSAARSDGGFPPSYYVRGHLYRNDSTISNIMVVGLSDSFSVRWTQEIVHRIGFTTSGEVGRGICLAGGNIIIVGETELEKEKNPAPYWWSAGLVASITQQGAINWIKAVRLTDYSDAYYDCFVDGNTVWATGMCSNYMNSPSQRMFGYGFLSKIDAAAGNVLSNMSFGDEGCETGHNSVIVSGNQAYCAGWTNYRISGGNYQSWIAEVNISNPPAPSSQAIHPGPYRSDIHTEAMKAITRPANQ